LLADLGPDVVLEHHSNLSPEKETTRSRLATENWDAPIVVTTAVQFYESLFAAKTSQSRKLHNIGNSVVILDEAQALPVQYLKPCLRALEQLSSHYHTTTVLCTATQPAVGKTTQFDIGLDGITEIIRDTSALFASLKRVEVRYRETLDDPTIIDEIGKAEQALCIVNTRKHAQALYQLLPQSDENYHLSALMCPEHRLQILATVRQRLDDALPTRLISTQLIEAGVDIDFPTVYRSMAGLDSISQAAGRCNRNGKLHIGHVHIFHSEHTASEVYFRETANVGHEILDLHAEDPLSTAAVNAYFDKYYYQQKSKWDSKDIMSDFEIVRDETLPLLFQYKSAADKFKLIENNQIPIIIPWDEKAKELCNQLRNESIPLHRKLFRSLQRYTVQIYENQFRKNHHQFETLRDGDFNILICPETHYSNTFGLNLTDEAANAKTLIY
jgi:CRISPR-associated endonuclease/helicase Cas3